MTTDLVVGATGILGGVIAHELAAKGRKVRALVRSTSAAEKRAALEAAGVELVEGDLKHPESLKAACEGVTNLITTATSTLSRAEGDSIASVDLAGNLNLLEAAKGAGVGHLIVVSFPEMDTPSPIQDAKRAFEAAIRASGVHFTILQPTIFWEIWCSAPLGFDVANAKARIYGEGEGRHSWISMFDVKSAVIASLENPAALDRTFRLGGPEILTQLEIVRRFEAATGKSFEREHIPLEALRQQHAASQVALEKSFAALMINCALGGWEFDMSEVKEALGIELTPIDAFVGSFRNG